LAIAITLYIFRRVYAAACLTNLDAHIFISAATATEGDTLMLTEVLTNNKWLPLPWVALKFNTGKSLLFATGITSDAHYRNDLFHILMHQKITRRLPFECGKRGFYTIDGLELTAWDLLMEQKYIRRFPCHVRLTVYPATIPTADIDNLCTRVYGQLRTRHPINPDPFTFRGIREYSHSDPMKAINFKASAKGAGLMVNMWDFSNARQVAILLDTARYTLWHSEYLEERAIKIAASIATKMNATETPTSFATYGKSSVSGNATHIAEGLGAQHLRGILEALAFVDFAVQDTTPIAHMLDSLTQDGHHTPEYWLVTPYYDKSVEASFLRLKQAGARAVWVMPAPKPNFDVYEDIIFM
jgi:hypothetical protein